MNNPAVGERAAESDPVACSRHLLDAARAGEGIDAALGTLAALDESALRPVRAERATALAFWINCYNAATQILLDRRPELYESPLRTVRFFRADVLTVDEASVSLDDIEHGILRGSRSKYGLGYAPRIAGGDFERRYRVGLDPRVHFALNCGAASCPAIRYYEPNEIDDQLDLAAETYLHTTTEYDADTGTVHVPRVFLWYHGDFDDPIALLRTYDVLPPDVSPELSYRSWDWSRSARKFA